MFYAKFHGYPSNSIEIFWTKVVDQMTIQSHNTGLAKNKPCIQFGSPSVDFLDKEDLDFFFPHVTATLSSYMIHVKTDCVTCRSAVAAALLGCSSAVRGTAAKPTSTWASIADTSSSPAARERRGGLGIKAAGTLSERGLLSTPLHLQKKVLTTNSHTNTQTLKCIARFMSREGVVLGGTM